MSGLHIHGRGRLECYGKEPGDNLVVLARWSCMHCDVTESGFSARSEPGALGAAEAGLLSHKCVGVAAHELNELKIELAALPASAFIETRSKLVKDIARAEATLKDLSVY